MEQEPTLLDEVKDYLKITWEDEDTEVQRIIDRGQSYLNELAGVELDFETEGLARSLFFDYCRYAYNNATEFFEENFRTAILRLQLMTGVAAMESGADD